MHSQWAPQRCITLLTLKVMDWFTKVSPKINHNEEGVWCWDAGRSGCYTVKEGYLWLRDQVHQDNSVGDWSWV